MFVEEILGGLPLPDRALWKVTGEDRVRYLNGQVTNDLTLLAPGRSLYGAVLTGKGRMEGEGFFAAAEDAVWIDAPLPVRESLRARLEKFLIADDAVIEDVTDSYCLSHWFGEEAPPAAPGRIVSRSARFGPPGWDVWEPGATPLLPARPAAPEAVERARIEHAVGAWGRELGPETLPQEARLEEGGRGLSYEKGCYVGQETVARVRSIGHVNRRLVLLRQASGPAGAPETPQPLAFGEKEVGKLTSAAEGIALGYVPRALLEEAGEFRAGERTYRIAPPKIG